jgi:UDP-N-acetylmuramoylalanine--D-glutamate ligase
LAAFPQAHWLAGGVAKEGGIASLERFFGALGGAYFYGQAGGGFRDTFLAGDATRPGASQYESLDQAVRAAFMAARREREDRRIVLLSPACASFDQYTDYEARGAAFRSIVGELAALHDPSAMVMDAP